MKYCLVKYLRDFDVYNTTVNTMEIIFKDI